jgi:uncharacterized protein YggT (Ycf19 family)
MLGYTIATFVDLFATIFNGLIIARIVTGLFAKPENRFYGGLVGITEPLLAPVRQVLPSAGWDFSPTVVVIGLYIIDVVVSNLLISQ